MVTFQLFARPALAALQGASPAHAARDRASLAEADRAQPASASRRSASASLQSETTGLEATPTTGAQGSHVLTSMVGADGLALIAPGEGEAAAGERVEVELPVRPRDPRRLLERHRRARARVTIVHEPQSGYSAEDRATGSRQVAEVTLPREELEKLWSPEHLERLARTYWSFLSRFSLGLIRVVYTADSREVVFLRRPFVLLRFRQAGVRLQRRRRHRHLADQSRRPGGEARPRPRLPAPQRPPQAGRGRRARGDHRRLLRGRELLSRHRHRASGRWIYEQTQLRIHVIVTHAFLRSLANLELEPSRVGALRAVAEAALTPAARR